MSETLSSALESYNACKGKSFAVVPERDILWLSGPADYTVSVADADKKV